MGVKKLEKAKILIVEDESRIRHLLKLFFDKEVWDIFEAEDGIEALNIIQANKFDIIILDLMMPKMDGWQLCKKIKETSDIPVIMLTARGEESDRILGFELGADDYVVKPFSPVEMVLRVKALLKRTTKKEKIKTIKFPDLQINPETHSVTVAKEECALTPLEFSLLTFLAQNVGKVFSREQLLAQIWGYDYAGETRSVDTSIKRLREKLANNSPEVAAYVKTVWGLGYKFEVNVHA